MLYKKRQEKSIGKQKMRAAKLGKLLLVIAADNYGYQVTLILEASRSTLHVISNQCTGTASRGSYGRPEAWSNRVVPTAVQDRNRPAFLDIAGTLARAVSCLSGLEAWGRRI